MRCRAGYRVVDIPRMEAIPTGSPRGTVHSMAMAWTLAPSRWRRYVAGLFRRLSDRLGPDAPPGTQHRPEQRDLLHLPDTTGLDPLSLDRGEMRRNATDAVWDDAAGDDGLVDLREHVRRLCMAVIELDQHPLGSGFDAVAHNLKLAYSLTAVSADTDIDGTSAWCRPAADYEAADEVLTEKYLAATIVFTFVWTAYERLVDASTKGPGGKGAKSGRGAKGRDLAARIVRGHPPHLRRILLDALELDRGGIDFSEGGMSGMLRLGSMPGMAAEHLRQFRNRMAHGDLRKPEPRDWGKGRKSPDHEDADLRRFRANVRLLLLIIQLLVASGLRKGSAIQAWLEQPCDARQVLRTLHCIGDDRNIDEPELELG